MRLGSMVTGDGGHDVYPGSWGLRESWTNGSSGVRPIIRGPDWWAVKTQRLKTIPVAGLDSPWRGRQARRLIMNIPSYVTDSM